MNKAIGLLIATFLVVTGCSASAQKVPALNGRVVDDANLLDLEIETLLNGELEETERQYGHQFVVVTVQSLQGKSIDEYGLTLGNAWGIGDKKRNDGLILLIAPNERRVRIEVGYGLESSFRRCMPGHSRRNDFARVSRRQDAEGGCRWRPTHPCPAEDIAVAAIQRQ
jgi:uncharacterized protein